MKLDVTTTKVLQGAILSAEGGSYSDLVIKCGTDEYFVHKVLVCTRSPFFAKEGQSGEIDLPDDDPEAVQSMVTYLYRGNYPKADGDAARPDLNKLGPDWDVNVYGEETIGLQDEYLCLHAKVYALADKYSVSGLKDMALRNFVFLVPRTISPHNFAEAADIVYTMTAESDRGLRDQVVQVLYNKRHFMEDEALKKLLKRHHDLALDFLMYQYRQQNLG